MVLGGQLRWGAGALLLTAVALAADGQLTGTVAAIDLAAACVCAAAALDRRSQQPRLSAVLWTTVAALVVLGAVCALA